MVNHLLLLQSCLFGREVYAVSLFCDVVFNVLERTDSLTSFSGVLVVVWLSVFCASSSLYRVLVYGMIVVFPDHTDLLLTWARNYNASLKLR